jgi:hypothetical protein
MGGHAAIRGCDEDRHRHENRSHHEDARIHENHCGRDVHAAFPRDPGHRDGLPTQEHRRGHDRLASRTLMHHLEQVISLR